MNPMNRLKDVIRVMNATNAQASLQYDEYKAPGIRRA